MLKQHRSKLDELAQILLKDETMTIEEFLKIFEGKKRAEEAIEKEAEKRNAV